MSRRVNGKGRAVPHLGKKVKEVHFQSVTARGVNDQKKRKISVFTWISTEEFVKKVSTIPHHNSV